MTSGERHNGRPVWASSVSEAPDDAAEDEDACPARDQAEREVECEVPIVFVIIDVTIVGQWVSLAG